MTQFIDEQRKNVANIDPDAPQQTGTFQEQAFLVSSFDEAKRITVTDLAFKNGRTQTTDERWEAETNAILNLIDQWFSINDSTVVMDFGCGTGRISKGLIERYGCKVYGVDASKSMLNVAMEYVDSPNFEPLVSTELYRLDIQVDLVISIWVLQHVKDLDKELNTIYHSLKLDGDLFLLNEYGRLVPTWEYGWAEDGLKITELIKNWFDVIVEPCKPDFLVEEFQDLAFTALYRKRKETV